MIRSFFCILKTEIFYDYEKTVYYLDHLVKAVMGFIGYYDKKQIKVKLKGLSPVQHRTKSFPKIICLTVWAQYIIMEFSDNYLIFSNMLSMCWMDFSRPSK